MCEAGFYVERGYAAAPHVQNLMRSSLRIRYNYDDDTDLPHIYGHGVTEAEVEQVLLHPSEDRPGRKDSRIAIGMTDTGRILKVIHVPDPDRLGTFVVTAFDLTGKALSAFRRRMRKRGRR